MSKVFGITPQTVVSMDFKKHVICASFIGRVKGALDKIDSQGVTSHRFQGTFPASSKLRRLKEYPSVSPKIRTSLFKSEQAGFAESEGEPLPGLKGGTNGS